MPDTNIEKILAELGKDFGDRVFKASEAPPVRVISTGITSLDVATGIGGWPRGTVVEIYGRPSSGKTAMLLHTFAAVHRANGFTALVNLESGITQEGWLNWAVQIAPPGFDPARLVVVNAKPGSESVQAFGKLITSGAFDVIGFDSIGAMSTDKEIQVGESKQAYGQSALVAQLIKQAAYYAYEQQCVPIFLNQIRDDAAGNYVVEKAPGGRAKEHFATLRVQLKTAQGQFKNEDIGEGTEAHEKDKKGFEVRAKIVKSKVGAPRRSAHWDFWNYPSPDGVLGIDVFASTIDTALQKGLFRKSGGWYYHDDFPSGKLNGGAQVTAFLRGNPEFSESVRRELVMGEFNKHGNVMDEPEREMLTDVG